MVKRNNKKGLTLVETFVSISIISLLILIIVQIMLIFSKLSKRSTYLSDSDIKTKEIALKIERAIYNVKNLTYFDPQFLYVSREIPKDINKITDVIYAMYEGQKQVIAKIFLNPIQINKKYYRKVIVYYYKKDFNNYNTNYLYLPEETFWKIEEILYYDNNKAYLGNYALCTPSFNTYRNLKNVNRKLYSLQRFKIYFYFYSPDINNRPFSIYKKYGDFLRNEYKKKYFIKKSYFMIFDYLYY
ncbi:MAG: hypothetical protein ACP5RD_01210 [bacterium]